MQNKEMRWGMKLEEIHEQKVVNYENERNNLQKPKNCVFIA